MGSQLCTLHNVKMGEGRSICRGEHVDQQGLKFLPADSLPNAPSGGGKFLFQA